MQLVILDYNPDPLPFFRYSPVVKFSPVCVRFLVVGRYKSSFYPFVHDFGMRLWAIVSRRIVYYFPNVHYISSVRIVRYPPRLVPAGASASRPTARLRLASGVAGMGGAITVRG